MPTSAFRELHSGRAASPDLAVVGSLLPIDDSRLSRKPPRHPQQCTLKSPFATVLARLAAETKDAAYGPTHRHSTLPFLGMSISLKRGVEHLSREAENTRKRFEEPASQAGFSILARR